MISIRAFGTVSIAAFVFLLDTFTTLGSAFATLYSLVIIVSSAGNKRKALIAWPIACALLTLLSFAIVHGSHPDVSALLRMAVSLAAIAVTTALMRHRRLMDVRLRHEQRHYETVFNSLAIAIWEHDFRPVAIALERLRENGVSDMRAYIAAHPEFVIEARKMVRITDVNQTAIDMMGLPNKEAFFGRLSDFLPETDESFADCLLAIDERRAVFESETTVRTAAGDMIDIIVTFRLSGPYSLDRVPGSVLDITKRGQLERIVKNTRAELERAQRSASVAAMSASIAHEINQPLSAIQNYVDTTTRWLQRSTPDIHEALAALDGLRSCVQNAHEVVRRVRNLVRDASGDMREIALQPLLEDVAKLTRIDPHPGNRVVVMPSSAAYRIIGDRILLQQLFLNLINNAFQAMDENDEFERKVDISSHELWPDKVRIRVRDYGPGWDPSVRERAFDSFYSTKSEGMGLGLVICRSIVDAHGGEIQLDNDATRGAIVIITLPVLNGANMDMPSQHDDDRARAVIPSFSTISDR